MKTRKIVPLVALNMLLGSLAFGQTHEHERWVSSSSLQIKGIDLDNYWIKGFGSWVSENLDQIIADGATWVQYKPTWWMDSLSSVSIEPLPDTWSAGQPGITISDAELVQLVRFCHDRGLKIFLSPTVYVKTYEWSGNISPVSIGQWFNSYETFILHYAQIAEANNVELFGIGNDLRSMEANENNWRSLIDKVREIYHGQLTYCSGGIIFNQNQVRFWDILDYIGVWFFKPASSKSDPTVEEMVQTLRSSLNTEIKPIQALYNKPVIFTGVGCFNVDGANQRPWYFDGNSATVDNQEQADYYEAIFRTTQNVEWFGGLFWSHWGLKADNNYFQEDVPFTLNPKWKAAESVIRRWFEGSGPLHKSKSALVLAAYDLNGNLVGYSDFLKITNYVADVTEKWIMANNYGVFYIDTPPYTQQIGSLAFSINLDNKNLPLFVVPSDTSIYFTCLWRAPNIGTVWMRADNQGAGFRLLPSQVVVINLTFEFARSEFKKAEDLYVKHVSEGYDLTAGLHDSLNLARAYLDKAITATDEASRSMHSYQSLAFSMILKENIIYQTCKQNIEKHGRRDDFIFSYLGVGSWIDPRWDFVYNRAKEAGFEYVYTHCDWREISPSKGVYDFSKLDKVVERANKLGFKVTLDIIEQVEWMPDWCKSLTFEELRQVYYNNVYEAVSHYKDRVPMMYAIGEPTLGTANHTIEEIGELTRTAFDAARKAAPDREFGIFLNASAYVAYEVNRPDGYNGISSWDFVNYMATRNIKADYVGLEMQYATIFAPIDLQRVHEILSDYHSVLKIPIDIAEITYSSKAEDYVISSDYFWHTGLDQASQADWARSVFTIAYGTDFIRYLSWTHLDPDNNDWGDPFLSSLIGSNLVKADGTLKEAYHEVKKLIESWKNMTSVGDTKITKDLVSYNLLQNYPNPFNTETIIKYELPRRSKVKMKIYNLFGQEITTLLDEEKEAGSHQVRWEGNNALGRPVASGIYLLRFEAGEFMKVRKMVVIR